MAYADIPTLKRSLVNQLAEILPNDWDGNACRIDYAHPGEKLQRQLHVWFFNARCVSEPGSMGAGRKRRDQVWQLTLMVQAMRKTRTVDPATSQNVGQEKLDAYVMAVFGAIDEWVADNSTLGQTTNNDVPVDYATVDTFTLEEGISPTGAGAVGTLTISVRIRPK